MKLKQIDYIFLIFLLFVTQGDIQLKLLGILLIFLRPQALIKISGFSKFYIIIVLFHLCYGLLNLFIDGIDYLVSFWLVFIFWTISYLVISQINFFVKRKSIEVIVRTINTFFITCVLFMIYQYMSLAIDYMSINPYNISPAAGDKMKSIYNNSSVNMIVMSFFLLYYGFRGKWNYAIVSLICLSMTTYMSGTVIFLSCVLVSIFYFSKIKKKYKIYFLALSIFGGTIFSYVSPSNVNYAMGYINRIIESGDRTPHKVKSFWQTLDYSTSSVSSFFFGAGGGNFSSRTAFISSGDYVSWYPQSLLYVSEEFDKYHLGIWTHDFKNKWDNRNNTANQPFSFYNQIVGEYGLIGVFTFLMFYLGYIIKNRKRLSYSKFMVICLLGYFVLDYWFEYFSVIIIFELLLMLDIKLNSKPETSPNSQPQDLLS